MGHWSAVVPRLDKKLQAQFKEEFSRTREDVLDACQGKCVLRRPELAKIVADSLLYFDGDRYRMGDFVIMPNHVHLLASFANPATLQKQCDSWLHFTAFEINKRLSRKGKLWQQEPFGHLVRSLDQFEYLRKYIAENPTKANLIPGEFIYRKR